MPRRILICIEDTGVAHVVAARLMKDGADGVVVSSPTQLVSEAKDGAVALVVQDKYPSGEAGASLLRQVKVAMTDAVPGVYLLTGELAQADRQVLQRQYKVKDFLSAAASPHQIAGALLEASRNGAPPDPFDPEIVLHEDEVKNDFDIEIASRADEIPVDELDASDDGFDEDSGAMTVEVQLTHLDELDLKDSDIQTELPTRRVHDEVTRGNPLMQQAVTRLGPEDRSFDQVPRTQEGVVDLEVGMTLDSGAADLEAAETGLMEFTMPPPGSSRDLQIPVVPNDDPGDEATLALEALSEAQGLDSDEADDEPEAAPVGGSQPAALEVSLLSPAPGAVVPSALDIDADETVLGTEGSEANGASVDEEDEMQVQQLKKALLQKKRELESAQKRIDDLEDQLQRMPSQAESMPSEGVPSEGVFEDLRYPALLARARQEAFTGTIKMQLPGDVTRTIYIRDGLPVGYTSSEPGDKIGKVLVAQGRITDDQYVKAATRMVERGIKLADALVDLGLLDAETLEVEVRNLTRDQIVAGFELTQGRFTTTRGEQPDHNIPTFDFGPGEIYVAGYRKNAPRSEMHAHYESLRPKYLRANAKLASFRPKLGLGGDDERLIRLLGEAYTVEEAVERAKLAPDDAARLIAALQALDLVEEWSPGVEQFRTRLTTERQYFIEEIAKIREEAAKREKQLFEGFERALAKIGQVMGTSAPTMKSSMSSTNGGGATPPPPVEAPESAAAAKTTVLTVPPVKDKPPEPTLITPKAAEPPPPPPVTPAPSAPTNGAAAASNGLILLDPAKLGSPASPADAKFHEAVRQAADNRLDEAEVTLREAVRMDATRPDFLVSLARVLLANPRYERSGTLPVVRSLLDRAVQLSPGDKDATKLHKEIVAEMGAGV